MSTSTITTLPWAGTPATATDTALWLDGHTADGYLREFGHGREAAALVRSGLKAIAEAIVEQRKEFPDSTLAQFDVHPTKVWRSSRRWDGPGLSLTPVVNLDALVGVLEEPLALQQMLDRKPTQLTPEAVTLLERFALRVRAKQS